jgi:uncharacterized membrane protein
VRSTRSRKYGIQPVPPSVSANLMSGKFLMTRDQRMSAAVVAMFMGCSVIITSTGALGAVTTSWPDEPRWTDTTVSVSQTAFHSGSQ